MSGEPTTDARELLDALAEGLPSLGRDAVATELERLGRKRSTPKAVLALATDLHGLSEDQIAAFLETRGGMTPEQQLTWRREITDLDADIITAYRAAAANLTDEQRAQVRAAIAASPAPEHMLDNLAGIKNPALRMQLLAPLSEFDDAAQRRFAFTRRTIRPEEQALLGALDVRAVAALPLRGEQLDTPNAELLMRLALINPQRDRLGRGLSPADQADIVLRRWPADLDLFTEAGRSAALAHMEALRLDLVPESERPRCVRGWSDAELRGVGVHRAALDVLSAATGEAASADLAGIVRALDQRKLNTTIGLLAKNARDRPDVVREYRRLVDRGFAVNAPRFNAWLRLTEHASDAQRDDMAQALRTDQDIATVDQMYRGQGPEWVVGVLDHASALARDPERRGFLARCRVASRNEIGVLLDALDAKPRILELERFGGDQRSLRGRGGMAVTDARWWIDTVQALPDDDFRRLWWKAQTVMGVMERLPDGARPTFAAFDALTDQLAARRLDRVDVGQALRAVEAQGDRARNPGGVGR